MKPSAPLFALTLMACALPCAWAADKIRIGFLATASLAPTIAASKEKKAGFDLAVKQLDGKLGGLPVEIITGDDQGNPEVGKQVFDRMVKRDKIDLLTGMLASGVINAVTPIAAQQQIFYINSNVGPRDFGGAKCSPYYFNTGWNIVATNESMGKYVSSAGYKKVYILGVGVPVGREHLEAFKKGYNGTVVGETYFKPQTLDFNAELAQIRAAQPDAVYAFAFGPLATNLIKQYVQAGLKSIPLLGSAPLADEETISSVGDPIAGVVSGGHWSLDLPNAANKQFSNAFLKEYRRPASMYNEQGYTTALIIDAAVRAVKGKIEDKAAFRKALENVKLDTPRGPFRFNTDHSPIQNNYLRNVVKSNSGELYNQTVKTIGTAITASDASSCKM
ncbi:MAG: ABC transporter substrate-binding protein [Polaromonas sp.]|uniref:ABC transporter substrate-binding protein n=1 Tax=Polaromonas sp. TaxID=1869339 RepID=UPI0025FAA1F0|nr:ABC transporter substrate-binding protein [Polaromonas sp.]MBI2725208.1 ABC transporter substrate-binding protein [Polaromonas sp.]